MLSESIKHRVIPLRLKIRRAILSSLLLFHVSSIFLNNLAWSPFVQCLYPYYYPYIQWTGQRQNWGMYKNPDHFDQQINYGFLLENGISKKIPVTFENSPRMLYFLEGLFSQGQEQEVMSYLEWKSNRIQKPHHLKSLVLQRSTRETPPPGILRKAQEYTLQKEYVLSFISSNSALQQDHKVSGAPP